MIYLNNNPSRDSYLFALNIHQSIHDNILSFKVDEIYNIILNHTTKFVIFDDYNLQNIHFTNFIQDLTSGQLQFDCRLLIIGNRYNNIVQHEQISIIDKNSYILRNETYRPTKSSLNRCDFIFAEISECDSIEHISGLFYPDNTTMCVRMVNNPVITNIHNLGIAKENQVLDIISECSYYLNLNNKYLYDAVSMHKPIINATDISKNIDVQNYIDYIIDIDYPSSLSSISEIIQAYI